MSGSAQGAVRSTHRDSSGEREITRVLQIRRRACDDAPDGRTNRSQHGRKENVPAMRKTSLKLLGTATCVALAIVAMQPRVAFSGADAKPAPPATHYRALNLFGDTFDRVRSRYVETPNDRELIEAAINGMLSGLENSYYVDAKSMKDLDVC